MIIPIGQTGSGALGTNRMCSIEQLVSLQLFTQSTGLRDGRSGAAQLAKKAAAPVSLHHFAGKLGAHFGLTGGNVAHLYDHSIFIDSLDAPGVITLFQTRVNDNTS
jgi:hypothetical protein